MQRFRTGSRGWFPGEREESEYKQVIAAAVGSLSGDAPPFFFTCRSGPLIYQTAMTKKQRGEAIAFMYENEVELVCATYGVYLKSSCELCCFRDSKACPALNDALLCRAITHSDFKTFFRKIK